MATLGDLAPGTVFHGDFRIVRPLSAGGMGAVFEVEQLSTGMPRALKVMHSELVADPDLRRRFEQEARVGARIASEHVVQVVAAGIDAASSTPFLVMELLSGQDLGALVKREGALLPARVAAIFDQLTHAIGAAHAVGIVHRDLKPENVFLGEARRSDSAFTVKVLDFGIAKILEEAKSSSTAAIGSPMWMAPEQTSRGSNITPAADVWALGLIAFHLLTGRHYWRAADDPSASMTNLLREIVLDPLLPASQRARECGVLLPPAFDAWFDRCVTRDPARRFPDARQANLALRESLAPPPQQSAAPPPWMPPSRPFAHSGPVMPTLAAAPTAPQPPQISNRARIAGGVALAGMLVAVAIVIATRSSCQSGAHRNPTVLAAHEDAARNKTAAINAEQLRQVTLLWLSEAHAGSCPTVPDLKASKHLDARSPAADPWGTPYVIHCEADDVRVVSAGPDAKLGTADDVVVPHKR